jgi:hypothetical protein
VRLSPTLPLLLVVACTPPGPADRKAGARAPLTAACDALDDTRCLLPWPSSTFTTLDATTTTGVRVVVPRRSLPQQDDPSPLNQLDGFSVATALAVGFPQHVAPGLSGQKGTTAVRLLNTRSGADIPLRLLVAPDSTSEADLLLAYPLHPLDYDTDYVAVVQDEVRPAAGGAFVAPRTVQVALKLVTADTDAEKALAAYHAPTRALLSKAGLDPKRVLRVWDFNTRSAESVTTPVLHRRSLALEVVDAGALDVQVTSASPRMDGGLEVQGRVGALPYFVTDAGVLSTEPVGVHSVPFRVVLPAGTGPLPMVVFGHGTGSDVHDPGLDDTFTSVGAAKLNLEFVGWTRATVPTTFIGFEHVLTGTEHSTAKLAQSLTDASALEAALGAQLGALLWADTVGGLPNPAAKRTLDLQHLSYFGSSLGGTLGYAHALSEPAITAAVLNVPGAGCSQFFQQAEQWLQLDAVFSASTPSALDRALALVLSQGGWDPIDGAAWAALPNAVSKPLLIQESIGDTVMPNLASELVAASSHAVQVGRVVEPVEGVSAQPVAVNQPTLTQYRLPSSITDSGALHAFVTKATLAGVAAREQLAAFLASVFAGAPRVVEPPTCAGNATSCDFFSSP